MINLYLTFYRATRTHSADYVRMAVTCRYCVQTVTHILKFFSLSGSSTILVF